MRATTRRDLLTTVTGAAVLGMVWAPGVAGTSPLLLRKIPSSGEMLPAIGLGTYIAFDLTPASAEWPQAKAAFAAFLECGGKLIDTSPMYGEAEAAIGTLCAAGNSQTRLFLATKVWTQGRDAGLAQMQNSQRALGRSPLDLIQVHNLVDVDTQLRTLAEWRQAKRVRYVGVTHYDASAYDALEAVMQRQKLDFVQVNYSLHEREAERRILPLARDKGLAVIANRPFGGGSLFSSVRARPLPAWAAQIGCTSWAQIFLKFVISHPTLTCAIPGSNNPAHVRDNMQAGIGPLPDAELRERIDRELRDA